MITTSIKKIFDYQKYPDFNLLKEIVHELIISNKTLNENVCGLSLLHVKAPVKNIKYLLDRGADPNVEGYYDIKPIHLQYSYDVIKLLVERGASPSAKDMNDFNPLFWQKDPEAINYLLQYNDIYISRIINTIAFKNAPYHRMLVEGGYDPFSEHNISVSPIFLQRNPESLFNLISHNYDINNYYDLAYETILFKPCINPYHIMIFNSKNFNEEIIDHQNILGNTALHVQYEPQNIVALLENGADFKILNNKGVSPLQYHLERNNLVVANIINKFSSASIIQRCWRRFWFFKTYISPKYYKIKKEFLEDFKLLPPSECKTFPGGIEYQYALEDFNESFKMLKDIYSADGSSSTSTPLSSEVC